MLSRNIAMAMQEDAFNALAAVAKKYGTVVKAAGGRIGHTNVVLKFDFAETKVDQNGQVLVMDSYASDFLANYHTYNLPKDALGKTFVCNGTVYTLIGAKPRAWKRPLIGKSPSGKLFKFSVTAVKVGLRGM